jgi:hypothetical protein
VIDPKEIRSTEIWSTTPKQNTQPWHINYSTRKWEHLGQQISAIKSTKGTTDLSNLPATLQSIFRQLHQLHTVDMSSIIDYDNFKDALERWKESTSTSPSSRHLGHYISVLKNIGDETDKAADKILRLHHTMLQVAQYQCKPFTRWKIETKVMLEKDKGNPKIEQLQIICFYKATTYFEI